MEHEFYIADLKIKKHMTRCLLFETRHDNELKKHLQELEYTVFDLRHTSNDWSVPDTIETKVVVDFWGYMALKDSEMIGIINNIIQKNTFAQLNNKNLIIDYDEYDESDEIPSEIPFDIPQKAKLNQGVENV